MYSSLLYIQRLYYNTVIDLSLAINLVGRSCFRFYPTSFQRIEFQKQFQVPLLHVFDVIPQSFNSRVLNFQGNLQSNLELVNCRVFHLLAARWVLNVSRHAFLCLLSFIYHLRNVTFDFETSFSFGHRYFGLYDRKESRRICGWRKRENDLKYSRRWKGSKTHESNMGAFVECWKLLFL